MLNCQACFLNPQTDSLTKCCKLFLCQPCKEKFQKNGLCICGKQIVKKLCSSSPQLFQIIKNFEENMPQQCDRCQQAATLQCKDCEMIYCSNCNNQVHAGKGFARHQRQPYNSIQPSKKVIQKIKRKQENCKNHHQPYEFICECGIMLCGICLKIHKETCPKASKIKVLKQYKDEFFSQIYFKIKQITQYKEKLVGQRRSYEEHFTKQKDVYSVFSKAIKDQLEGLKKILVIKSQQIQNKLEEYWKSCEGAYKKNIYAIQYHMKKYDDYARLTEKFAENYLGLDYLEKRIKKFQVNYDFFSFKVTSIEDIQSAIVNLSSIQKNWDINLQENILINLQNVPDEKVFKEKKVDLLGNIASNTEFLLECSQKPLNHRPLNLRSSHNEVQFQFLHLPYQKDTYQIQYGVGLKMKGQQIFKRIENNNGKGVISNLNATTKYRVRMRVSGGQWGPVKEIKTYDMPKFSIQNCLSAKNTSQSSIQLVKAATIYGVNEISFGVHSWQIRISPSKSEEDTACISIGVSNKENKKPIFVGTTMNYGYQKGIIIVKATLSCEQNRLLISSSTSNQDEVFQNLPNYPIYPTIQNKGNSSVHITYNFV